MPTQPSHPSLAAQAVRTRRLRAEAALGVLVACLAALVLTWLTGRVINRAPRADGGRTPIVLSEPRIVVLKSRRRLYLFDGDRLVRSYPVDLGIAPLGNKLRANDGRTPEGRFRLVTKNENSGYHRFLGIDYPNENAVATGLSKGLISQGEAASIRAALKAGTCPEWGTALGGGVGLHGGRRGHDWTGGCLALADEHVEELFSVLRLGDSVEILP